MSGTREDYAVMVAIRPADSLDERLESVRRVMRSGAGRAEELVRTLPATFDGAIQFSIAITTGDEVGKMPRVTP